MERGKKNKIDKSLAKLNKGKRKCKLMKLEIKEDITTDFNEVERSIRENVKDTKKNKNAMKWNIQKKCIKPRHI